MAITTPVSSGSSVTVVDQSPDTVYSATPGAGAFVEVTLTGALASAVLIQYSVEPSGSCFVSLDGTTNGFTVGAIDSPRSTGWSRGPRRCVEASRRSPGSAV